MISEPSWQPGRPHAASESGQSRRACRTAALLPRQSGRPLALSPATTSTTATEDEYTTTTQTPVRRCASIDHYETRTSGYRVTYEYEGRQFQTTLPYDPGPQLHVNVSVTPR